MADLSEIASSSSTKIAGAGPSSGIETNWMGVDANGSAQVGLFNAAGGAITTTTTGSRIGIDVNVVELPDPSAFTGTGSIAALNASYTINTVGLSTLFINIQGSWSGTLILQASNADTTYHSIWGTTVTGGSLVTNITGNTTFTVGCASYQTVQLIASAWSFGSASISYSGGLQTSVVNQGNAASISNAWSVIPTDGTFTQGFTAANEAKVSVTQPLPAGTNNIGTVTVQGALASGAVNTGENPVKVAGVFNTTLPTLTTGKVGELQIDSSARLIIAPLTTTTNIIAQIQDGSGNPANARNGQLNVGDIINTAGQFRAQSVTTTAAEALGAGTILSVRKFLSITPTNGTVYWGFANTVTTTTGTPIFTNQTFTMNIGPAVHVYLISAGTVDCRIAEGS